MHLRMLVSIQWLPLLCCGGTILSEVPASATLVTYPGYGAAHQSPDYEVTVQQGSDSEIATFAAYSSMRSQYDVYGADGTLNQVFQASGRNNTESHSSTIFSFSGTAVTVRVKVKPGAAHITLPLASCKVLPLSYNIPCSLQSGDTMVFTLDSPKKVFVIANYDTVWNEYASFGVGHTSISAWRDYSTQKNSPSYRDVNTKEISEGFKNPFIVIAHGLESAAEIPDKTAPTTLVVNPGASLTQTDFDNHGTIWFNPGVHDLSQMGTHPGNQVLLKRGQVVYLEGGAYVISRFKRNNAMGTGTTSVLGRGVLSGISLKWVKSHDLGSALIDVDTVKGITITDRACFGIHQNAGLVSDIAMIGAWHPNTMSIEGDSSTMEDSLLMSGDDNLKLLNQFQARRLTLWQGSNAHPIMVHENSNRDYSGSVAEDIDVVVYSKTPPQGDGAASGGWENVSSSAIACVSGGNADITNFTFRNIRILSPYLYRIAAIYNLDTNLINPGWFSPTSEARHTRVDGMLFQDITVTSPIIAFESLVGSAYPNSLSNVTFRNLVVNGIVVTEQNKHDYFEFEGDSQIVRVEPSTPTTALTARAAILTRTPMAAPIHTP